MTLLFCVTESRLVDSGADWLAHKSNGHDVETVELKERRRKGPHGFEFQLSTDWKAR